MKAETKYKGSIKLAAIGDALGWITEFEKNISSIQKKYNTDTINKFYKWEKNVGGKFNGYKDILKEGSYSDDTQLMLAIARSIKENGNVDNEYFSKIELPSWLLYSRGAGRTIKNAARKIERKSAKWYDNFFTFKAGKKTIDYIDSGANGAAMRILPIALANFGDTEKINSEIFFNSIITHGHPRAIVGAMLYGYAINTILKYRPNEFNYVSFLTELGKEMDKKLSINSISNKREIKEWLSKWNSKSNYDFKKLYYDTIVEAQNYLRNIYIFISKEIDDKEVFEKIGCLSNETKGSGISTVIAGIYLSSKYFKQPLKGIEIAVNMIGSDTDSIAAFTGGLLGALHGHNIIPDKWKKIQDYEYLEKVAIKLLQISEDRIDKNVNICGNDCNENIPVLDLSDDKYKIGDKMYFNPLGVGIISNIERQKAFTKGKYNLIIDVDFEIGQSCRFAKLLPIKENTFKEIIKKKEKNLDEMVKDFRNSLNDKQKKEFDIIIERFNKKKEKTLRRT